MALDYIIIGFKQNPLLWWRTRADDYFVGSVSQIKDIWERWTPSEFKSYLEHSPLTPKKVAYFLRDRIRETTLKDTPGSQICPISKDPILFDISLGVPKSERRIALIHEVIHGFYRFGVKRGEELVEAEAVRFCGCRDNEEFLEDFVDAILV
ncbi:MAG: hypothetical protein WC494_02210 [Candidatus Pacearchaeota archaeon]